MFSDAAPVLIAAALCGFAFQFMLGHVVREARLQLPVQAAESLILAAIGVGLAASFHAFRRNAASSPDRHASLAMDSNFAGAALVCAVPLFVAGWSTAGLERLREFLALRSTAPHVVQRAILALPLLVGASLASFFAVRAVLSLHGWHRRVLHQRLRAAVLWVALVVSAGFGGAVVLLVRDSNRYWPVPALLFLAASAIAAFTRFQTWQPPALSATRWPQAARKNWIASSVLLAAMTAAVTLPPPLAPHAAMTAQPMSLVVLMLGGCFGFLVARLAGRLHIDAEYVPLALPLAAFVQSAAPSFALRSIMAATLLLAGFALLIQHAARAMHSIPFSLATLGLAGSLSFAAVALPSALFADESALSYLRLGLLSVCVVVAGLLAWRSIAGGAARSACLTACLLWMLVGPFLPGHAIRDASRPEVSEPFHAEIRTRLISDSCKDRARHSGFDEPPDLEFADCDIRIVSAGPLSPESSQALRAGRWLRRLSREMNVGGRLIFEEPLDEQLAATLDRYAKRTRPAFGRVYDLRICGPASEYRAAVIGPDIEPWLAERAWPKDCQMQLQAR